MLNIREMHNEQVFTPSWMVNLMLNKLQYSGNRVLQKHIIDNSCGKGAFLTEIVDRYCKAYIDTYGNNNELKNELETYIHGIEIDELCWGLTIVSLNRIGLKYGLENVEWDVRHSDALELNDFNNKMDYVIGNPPYCNVHDFGEKYDIIKKFSFAQNGMSDLYLVFFEIGINMLNSKGKLLYITPSSWTTSIAGKPFRDYLIKTNKLTDVVVLGHEKIFKNATTFTMLTEISNNINENDEDKELVTIYKYNPETVNIDYIASRPLSLFTVNNNFYFSDDTVTIKLLNDIEKHDYPDKVKVKNGFATLNDKLFVINEWIYENDDRFGIKDIIPVIKASTGEEKWMVFPYDRKNGNKPFKFDELSKVTREYLLKRAKQLHMEENGKMDGEWWLYGRSQAINDYGKGNRYAINNLIRRKEDVKVKPLFHTYGVYSGFYIIADDDFGPLEWMDYLYNDEFVNYVKILGRYKNGGYYTFTSKDLQNYLNYKINLKEKIKNFL